MVSVRMSAGVASSEGLTGAARATPKMAAITCPLARDFDFLLHGPLQRAAHDMGTDFPQNNSSKRERMTKTKVSFIA